MAMRWYIVHAYSGQEKSIQAALIERIRRSGMSEMFGDVLVPTEEVVEMKKGAKAITGFVGGVGNKPSPVPQKEIDLILNQVKEGVEKPKPKVLFEVGELIRVKDGPFTDFNGNVEEVNYDKSKIRVSVLIFGRPTPVELDFGQVEKQ